MAFLYRLIAPRPTFAQDMTEDEAAAMQRHAGYLGGLLERRVVVAYGPVFDPAGPWGLGLIDVEDEQQARAVGEGDPAVTSATCRFELVPMRLVHAGSAAGQPR